MAASHDSDDVQLGLFIKEAAPVPTYRPPANSAVYRVTLVRESSLPIAEVQVRRSLDSERLIRTHLASADREYFVVIMLNRKNEVIGMNTVSMGSLTGSVVSPREVFKPAILANASGIICGHNHPSGDPRPSHEDRTITERLAEAGALLDIRVLDHVIVGDGAEAYYSFADNGGLE
jgi:DNA repair protein RadC